MIRIKYRLLIGMMKSHLARLICVSPPASPYLRPQPSLVPPSLPSSFPSFFRS